MLTKHTARSCHRLDLCGRRTASTIASHDPGAPTCRAGPLAGARSRRRAVAADAGYGSSKGCEWGDEDYGRQQQQQQQR